MREFFGDRLSGRIPALIPKTCRSTPARTYVPDEDADAEGASRDPAMKMLGQRTFRSAQGRVERDEGDSLILIRDSNKMICQMALSGRRTESEIEAFARMGQRSRQLRTIAQNRKWMKNYKVLGGEESKRLSLSPNLLNRLQDRDSRISVIAVPELLRIAAQEDRRRHVRSSARFSASRASSSAPSPAAFPRGRP
jgi:hypothetical protein